MKKTLIAFLTITILPILAYGYANESDCWDINNCPAGCGISFAGTAPKCDICLAGTYSSQADVFTNPHNVCESCGSLPEQNHTHTILSWYKSGAENIDECKYTFECETGYIINPEYQQGLALTNNIISINDPAYNYTEICSVKCGLNSYPNANQTACVCATGTYVQGTTKDTETTNGKDCVPYIVSLALNNPESTLYPRRTLNILTTLDNNTKKYILPGDLNNIDQEHNTQDGITTIRKTIWGKNLDSHNDTGYRIESWDGANFDFDDIQENYTLYPKWVEKTFTVYQVKEGTTPTSLLLYNKDGEKIPECTYNSPNGCYTDAPSESGYKFSHWDCKTLNYAGAGIKCTKESITTSDNLASISYGNKIYLTPKWEANTITLYYKSVTEDIEGPTVEATRTYKYGNQTTPGTPEQITNWNGTYSVPNWMVFTGWQCTRVDEYKQPLAQYGNCGIISATENIATDFDSGYILLAAQYGYKPYDCNSGEYLPANSTECTDCPAGYYCEGGKLTFNKTAPQGIEACPAGSTSDGSTSESKSDDITDCYITDQTKICDNSDTCFQIPEGIEEIHHN